jgi:hypothetical protein
MAQRLPTFSESLIVARSRGATSEAPNLWDGLVADWSFLQGGGATLFDIAGNNNGTLTNMDPATDWVTTQQGWALDFAAANNRIDPAKGLPTLNGFTWILRLFIRSDGVGTNFGRIVDTSTTDFIWAQNGDILFSAGSGSTVRTVSYTYTPDTYYHVVCVSDGSGIADGLRMYIDGELVSSAFSRQWEAAATWYIGNRAGADRSIDCRLSQLLQYDRALTPSEIQQLYADPHAMHRRRPVTVSFVDAGGGPSASIAPAAYHQAQMAGAL